MEILNSIYNGGKGYLLNDAESFLDALDLYLANVKALMARRKLKQKDLAAAFQLNPSTVNSWFKRKAILNLEQAQAIATYLGVEFYALCYDYNDLPLLDLGDPSSQVVLKNPHYRLAGELGYPRFKQEIDSN